MKKTKACFALVLSAFLLIGCSSSDLNPLKNNTNSANDTFSDILTSLDSNITTISDFEGWKNAIDNATDNLENNITLKIKNYNSEIYNLDALGYSSITVRGDGTIIGSTSTMTYTFDYSSNFKLLRAVKNNALLSKLNDTELATIEFFKSINAQIITDSMTDYEKELAIHDYIVKNYKYVSGEEKNNYYNVTNFIKEKTGYCEAYAYSFSILATLAELDNEIIFGSVDGVNHAWNAVKLDNEYYYVDPTFDDTRKDEPEIIYSFFNLDNDALLKTHTWDKAKNKNLTASGKKYNYFTYNHSYFTTLSSLENYILQKVNNKEKTIHFFVDGFNITNASIKDILSKKSALVSGYSIYGEVDNSGGFVLEIRYR